VNTFLRQTPYAILLAGASLVGLWWANFFFDHGIKHWQSRKIGHLIGGVSFLLCALLFSSVAWPLILTVGFTILLGGARIVAPSTFRGTGGTGRATPAWSEVYFPLISIPILAIGWGIYNLPLASVACILMMAWGDCLTGWVRALKYTKPTKGIEGSLVMLVVCLVISWAFITPFWLGAIIAVVATVVEFTSGDVSPVKFMRWMDDNWAIPFASFAILLVGLHAIGRL
jgi:dolichol kinase